MPLYVSEEDEVRSVKRSRGEEGGGCVRMAVLPEGGGRQTGDVDARDLGDGQEAGQSPRSRFQAE